MKTKNKEVFWNLPTPALDWGESIWKRENKGNEEEMLEILPPSNFEYLQNEGCLVDFKKLWSIYRNWIENSNQ